MLDISLLAIIPNACYTPEHQDYLSFRPRKSNRIGYLSKKLGFSHQEFWKEKKVSQSQIHIQWEVVLISCLTCPVPSTLTTPILRLQSYKQQRKNIILRWYIRTNKQHGHHPYRHHCSMVCNVNHNRNKQNHLWYDESTRGAETPQWWNIGINVRYIQGLHSSWQRRWKYHIRQSSTKEVDIPHVLGEG